MIRFIALLLVITGNPSARAAAPEPSEGRWNIDYGAQRCSLFRHAADADGTTLGLRIIPGMAFAELLFARDDWDSNPLQSAGEATIVLLPEGQRFDVEPIRARIPESDRRAVMMNQLRADFLTAFGRSNGIVVEVRGKPRLELALADAGKALKALTRCNDALLAAWGVDPVVLDRLSKYPEPIGGFGGWFDSNLYPQGARVSGRSGTVVVRLDIRANEDLARCTVVAGSGSGDLDEQTCVTFYHRAKFKPALDEDGQPTAVGVIQTIEWAMRPR